MPELAPNTAYPVGQLTPSIVLYEPSFEGWLSAVFMFMLINYMTMSTTINFPRLLCTLIDCSSNQRCA